MAELIGMSNAVWKRQPQVHVELNLRNPLTRGLFCLWDYYHTQGWTVYNTSAITRAVTDRMVGYNFNSNCADYFIAVPAQPYSLLCIADFSAVGNWKHLVNIDILLRLAKRDSDALISVYVNTLTNSGWCDFGFSYSGVKSVIATYDLGTTITFDVGGVSTSQTVTLDPGTWSSGNRVIVGSAFDYNDRIVTYWGKPIYLAVAWNRVLPLAERIELYRNPWQLFAPAPSRFYLIPSSGTSSYQLVSSFASASTSSSAALNIQRVLASTCASLSSTPSISLVSLIPLLSALTSASSTATSAWQVLRALQSTPISDSSTSPAALAIERALVSALTSASLSATSALNVQRNFLTALSSESAAPTITLSIAGLLALLSAISSSSSTAAPAIAVQRGLLSALTGQSATGDITLNTTTLIALLSAVASTSLSASSALSIARSLSTAISSPSSTADAALPVQRPLTTAAASQSSTSISALELINLIALVSGVSSQSSTATATANLARALVSSLLSASSTATISLPVLRELASTLVSISLNDAIDLALAVAGQVDLVSMIESGSLTNPQVRLLADLVAAIQTEMKLQMTGVSPSLKMTGSGPSIAVHRT